MTDDGSSRARAAILDVDGTLVDTNYHHAIAWHRALRSAGTTVPVWEIHRHIGMGGDRLVAAIAGDEFEREHGDAVRDAEAERYADLIEEVETLEGAHALLERLRERGLRLVLASSAKAEEVEHYVDLLDARELADDWTTSADVETTKPAPDLVEIALEKAGTDRALMIGDTTWDAIAAGRARIPCVGVLTGGFSEAELREAGAAAVYRSVVELGDDLDRALSVG